MTTLTMYQPIFPQLTIAMRVFSITLYDAPPISELFPIASDVCPHCSISFDVCDVLDDGVEAQVRYIRDDIKEFNNYHTGGYDIDGYVYCLCQCGKRFKTEYHAERPIA